MTDQRSSSFAATRSTPRGSAASRRRPRLVARPLALALAGASLLSLLPGTAGNALAQAVPALPTGMTVIQGQVNAVTSGNKLTVTNSAGSIVNWQGFSIGAGNAVTFVQPNAQSAVLNRVVGNDPSAILGSLSSNGRVWLLNPNGVLFGQGARIDVGGLVTSTLNLNDADWLSGQSTGRFKLFGDSSAGIVNQGELRSSLGGHIALLAGGVRNEGLIEAPNGQILLAAGKSIELIDTGSPNLRLKVTAPDGQALNLGTLQAANGRIDVHGAVVNQQGIARADSLSTNAAGEIVLSASEGLNLGSGSVTSAAGATGGKIMLDSGASGTTLISGDVLTTGVAGMGGTVTVLGRNVGLVDQARIDASGATGGGQVNVGGGERGQDAAFRNSTGVYVGAQASIAADATGQGNGGRIVLWGDEATRAYGSFSARGGPQGGNGGFIETSGHWIDVQPAKIDATAVAGMAGTWLLDPYNIEIASYGGNLNVGTGPNFTSSASPARVTPDSIIAALNAGSNVVIATGAGGTEPGDITATGVALTADPTAPVSLSLLAHGNINITNSVISTSNAALGVTMQAGISGTGRVMLTRASTVTTRGGTIDLRGLGYQSTDFSVLNGVYLIDSTLDAGAGLITLNGSSNTTTSDATGVFLAGGSLRAGTISATGTGTATGSGAGAGVRLSNTTLTADTITLAGTAQMASSAFATGVGIGGSSLTASEAMNITGTSTATGVSVGAGSLLQVTSDIAARGGAGMVINGTSSWSNFSASFYENYGVQISGQYGGSLRTNNGANLSIVGSNVAGGLNPALSLSQNLIVDATSGGNATFRGNGSAQISATMRVGGSIQVLADTVTILSGSSLRSDAAGDALIVAGAAAPNTTSFVNQAGATAFTTPNGRWLVYGQNVGAVSPGGLPYDFKQYDARYGDGKGLTPATGNGLLYAAAPVVTIGANNVSKFYDGTLSTGALTGLTFNGQLDNDKAIGSVTGSFADKNAGTNKPVNIDATGITFTDTLDKPVYGYTVSSTVRGDIQRKAVTLGSVSAANKAYDGNTTASVTAGPLSGLVGSETLTTSTTGNFDTKDVGNNKAVSVTALLGDGGNGGLASNYILTPSATSTTASITPRALSFSSISAQDKLYDGNRTAVVSAGTLVGLVGSETLTTSLSGLFDTKDVGNNKLVTVGVAAGNGSNGGLLSNYSVPTSTTTRAAISPAALTVRANDASKTFGSTLTFSGSEFTTSGLVAGETVGSVTLSSTGATAAASVTGGPYPIVPSNAIGGSFSVSNYNVTYLNGTLTVTPANLQAVLVGIVGNPTKVYDGSDLATLNAANFSLSGFIGSDAATVNQPTGRYDSPNAGARTVTANLSTGNYTPTGSTDLKNYTLPTLASGAGTITPRTLTLTGLAANNKIYDGNVTATLGNGGALAGLVGGQTLVLGSGGASFDNKDVGLGKTVTVNGLALANGSGLASNYVIAPTASTTADISPKALTVVATAANKVYDGNTSASILIGSLNGLVGAETLNFSATGSFNSKDVGVAKPVTLSTSGLANGSNGGLASNYSMTPFALSADITPRTLTLGPVTAASKVYDGNAVASVNLGPLGNLVGSETLTSAASGNFDTKDAGNNKLVSVNVTLGNGSNGGLVSNYQLPTPAPTARAAITPATLTYTANPANKIVGAPLPALSGGLSGFVAGETLAGATNGAVLFTTPALSTSPAGFYAVNGSGLTAANYGFVQAASNATALTVTGLSLQQTDQGSETALSQSLAVVTPTSAWSSPSEGRLLDVFQALGGNFLAQGSLFNSLPVADFSQDQLTTLLAARDRYKKGLFAEAIRKLEQDPNLADAPACQSIKEVDNGTCLITEDLKRQLRAERDGVQIANGRPPAPATAPSAAPAATPAPAAPTSPRPPAPAPSPTPQAAAPLLAADVPSLSRRRVRSASLPQIERKIAIVIGVDRYNDKSIPQLDNSVRDANSIGRLLEATLGYDTVVLPNATKATVIRTLNRLAVEAGPNDSVVVYYAGHGDVVPATGLGYWQLNDSSAKRPETWLSNADITRLIGQIGASQVALISDSCYSGSLVDERLRGIGGTVDPQTLLTRKTVVVMSSGGNEPVFDSGKQGHSPFAYSLMNNLQQVATWQAGGNVFERIRFAVARELPQRPRYGTASAAGHQAGGDYLFEQRQLDVTP